MAKIENRCKLEVMGKEEIPNKLEVSDDRLIARLREDGIRDPEVKALLDTWTAQQEAKVGKESLNSIQFNQRRANVYLKAGFTQEALDNLEDAAIQARNEGRRELYNQIITEIDRIITN